MSRSELLEGRCADTPIRRQIRRNFHSDRSGAVHLIPDQYWFLHSTDEAAKMGLPGLAAIHGSPWSYDTYVPIFFAGHEVSPRTITRRVATTDVAPTIAAYLGIKPFVVYTEERDTLDPRSVMLENRAFVIKATRLFRF